MSTLEEQVAKIDRRIARIRKKAEPIRAQVAEIEAPIAALSDKRRGLERRLEVQRKWGAHAPTVLAAWTAYCAGDRPDVLVPTAEKTMVVTPTSQHGPWIVHLAIDFGTPWAVTLGPSGLRATALPDEEQAIALAESLHAATPPDFNPAAYYDPVPAWMRRAYLAHQNGKRSKAA